jgi:hypothetical protein
MHEFMNRGYHARDDRPVLMDGAGWGVRGGDLRFEIGRVGRGLDWGGACGERDMAFAAAMPRTKLERPFRALGMGVG